MSVCCLVNAAISAARWCPICYWGNFVVEKVQLTSTGSRSSSTDIGGVLL